MEPVARSANCEAAVFPEAESSGIQNPRSCEGYTDCLDLHGASVCLNRVPGIKFCKIEQKFSTATEFAA